MSIKRSDSLKRGKNNTEMILLNILCSDDYYGYQLSQLINKYSKRMISILEIPLYPTLYQLRKIRKPYYLLIFSKIISKFL